MMLSGHGLPEMPPGGSLESRLKSRIRRRLQLVDYNQTRREQKIHGRDRQNKRTMTVVTGEDGLWAPNAAAFLPLSNPPGIGQPSVTWWISLKHISCHHGVSSLVSLPKIGLFSSQEMNFHAKLKATSHSYLILSNERGRRAPILSNQMLPRPCASGDVCINLIVN
jgi:hypothetical protein